MFPRNSVSIFRGNSEETQILGFLGISEEIPREIPRISFFVGMSVRIPLFSCSGSLKLVVCRNGFKLTTITMTSPPPLWGCAKEVKVDIAEMRRRCYEPETEAEVDVVQSKVI
ncbi:hypothetical protein DY000_02033701 [Brassica cretica]|uniref:Uncharacterized protein n=1 Tax=Brassica cretica TaxID=69181 RepID=A0ABQ7DKW6_BRACR|nr:hypothetical protein DY000_02033701 [Brassica cretica]